MTIDHAALVAEARRRLDIARAAREASGSLSRWTVLYMGVTGYPQRVTNEAAVIIAETYEGRSIQEEVTYAPLAEHIAVWDPAAAVAVCEGWLDVLLRHRPMDSAPRFCTDCRDHVLLTDCLEVRAVARQMRMEASEPPATPKVTPCPEGFHWIGQRWSSCDECGLPAWEHEGMAELGSGPDGWVLQPWAPGEREVIRAKWEGH